MKNQPPMQVRSTKIWPHSRASPSHFFWTDVVHDSQQKTWPETLKNPPSKTNMTIAGRSTGWMNRCISYWKKWGIFQCHTLPKFNIAPEKWWLEDYFPFGMVYFQGWTVKLPWGISEPRGLILWSRRSRQVPFPYCCLVRSRCTKILLTHCRLDWGWKMEPVQDG